MKTSIEDSIRGIVAAEVEPLRKELVELRSELKQSAVDSPTVRRKISLKSAALLVEDSEKALRALIKDGKLRAYVSVRGKRRRIRVSPDDVLALYAPAAPAAAAPTNNVESLADRIVASAKRGQR